MFHRAARILETLRRSKSLKAAFVFILLLNIYFFPVLWQGKTFVTQYGMPQVMPGGVLDYKGFVPHVVREYDPAAPFWILYPACKLTHNIWFSERDFALWNPYNGAGIPYIAESTTPVYNIFASILFLLPSAKMIDFYLLFRFFLAGFFMYLFSRRLLNSFVAALFCGIAYMFQGYSLLYLTHVPNNVYFMTPLLFLAFHNLLKRGDLRSALLAGATTGLVITAGFPESSFLVILAAYAYVLLALSVGLSTRPLRIMKFALFAGLIGMLLSAVYLLPLSEFAVNSFHAHSKNFRGEIPGFMAAGPISHYFINYLIPLFYSVNILVSPHADIVHSSGLAFTYFGIAVFTLALFGLIHVFSSSLRRPKRGAGRAGTAAPGAKTLAAFLLLLLLLLLKYTGCRMVNWIGGLPIFNIIIFTNYSASLIAFCVIVTSGWGLKYFLKTRRTKFALPHYASVLIVGLIIGCYCVDTMRKGIHLAGEISFFSFPLMVAMGFAMLLLVALVFSDRRRAAPGMLSFFILFIVAFELFFNFIYFEYYYVGRFCDRNDLYKEAPYVKFLKENAGFNRVFGVNGILFPNWSSAFGIFDARNIYAMTPLRWVEFYRSFFPGGTLGHDGFDRFIGSRGDVYCLDNPSFKRFAQLCGIKYYLSLLGADTRVDEMMGHKRHERLAKGCFHINGERKAVLWMDTDIERFPWKVRLPPDASRVSFYFAIPDIAWHPQRAEEVVFRLEARSPSGDMVIIFERGINPKKNPEDRRWFYGTADVSGSRGQEVTFLFSGLSTGTAGDIAGWADFRLYDDRMNDISAKIFPEMAEFTNVYANEIFIDELSNIPPRASVFHNVELIRSDGDILKRLKDPDLDVLKTLIIKEDLPRSVKERMGGPRSGRGAKAEIIEYRTGRVRIRAETDGPAFLMLTDINYPGWKASVDGAGADIYTANYLFRAVFLEKGAHVVEFRYEPLSFRVGFIVSLLTLCAVCAFLAISRERRPLPGQRREGPFLLKKWGLP